MAAAVGKTPLRSSGTKARGAQLRRPAFSPALRLLRDEGSHPRRSAPSRQKPSYLLFGNFPTAGYQTTPALQISGRRERDRPLAQPSIVFIRFSPPPVRWRRLRLIPLHRRRRQARQEDTDLPSLLCRTKN